MSKHIEIIDIKLNINLAEEIRSKVDSLSSDIIEHTKELVKKTSMKLQRTTKKQQAREKKHSQTELVVKCLEEAFSTPDFWLEGKDLLEAVDTEVTSQNLNKLSMQIRKLLEIDDNWTLNKKRCMNKTVYRLTKFS